MYGLGLASRGGGATASGLAGAGGLGAGEVGSGGSAGGRVVPGATGEILYVSYFDSESGLRLTANNTPVRSGVLAFPVADIVSIAPIPLPGLGANALFGLWWTDPLAALAIAAVAVREGRESWRGEGCCDAC